MTTDIARQVGAHLEFFGYRLEQQDKVTRATHDNLMDFSFWETGGGVMAVGWFASEAPRARLLEFVNRLNHAAAVTRFLVDEDDDFRMEAFYPGPYTRDGFATFFQALQHDWQKLLGEPESRELLK